jgi:quercetin dioxygenase-like cupin family protein
LVATCAEVPPGQKRPEFGCFIIGTAKGLQFSRPTVYWHLGTFPSRAAAEAVKSATGIVVEEDGRVWLSEFGPRDSTLRGGEPVAVIGPLELPSAKTYDAVLSYAVMRPGDRSLVHTHPGPEGWYMLAGEQCLETQAGTKKAGTGETMTVPPNVPMELSIVGATLRKSLVLIIHDSTQAAIIQSDWKPSGACNANQSPASAQPLILQEGDGEHLLRRYAEQALTAAPDSIPEFIIKIDKQNGGAEDFVAVTEILKPGAIIPFHLHHNAEEILILEEDGVTVTVGNKRAVAGPRSTVFIPRETWISVTNTANHPIHLYALFSRPGFIATMGR